MSRGINQEKYRQIKEEEAKSPNKSSSWLSGAAGFIVFMVVGALIKSESRQFSHSTESGFAILIALGIAGFCLCYIISYTISEIRSEPKAKESGAESGQGPET